MALYQAIDRYKHFLRQPDVVSILIVSFFSRMPIGMMSLALLMYLSDVSGSMAFAGGQVGAYMISMGLAAPVVGRIIDRFGTKWVLRICGIVHPLALWLMLIPHFFPGLLPLWFLTVCMIFAGLFCPPTAIATRSAWRYMFPDIDLRQTAFSFDTVLTELNFVIGPIIIALLLSTGSTTAAFIAAITSATLCVPIFLLSRVCDYVKFDKTIERHWLGPLTEPKFIWILALHFVVLMTLGTLELAYPLFAKIVEQTWWGGILLTCCAIGSACGGIIYGGTRMKMNHVHQLLAMLVVLTVFVAAHLLPSSPYWLALCALLGGIAVAPTLTVLSILQAEYAPERYTAEAFTWTSTFAVAGIGSGMAVGGALGDAFGLTAVFLLAAGCCVIALFLALGLYRSQITDYRSQITD